MIVLELYLLGVCVYVAAAAVMSMREVWLRHKYGREGEK